MAEAQSWTATRPRLRKHYDEVVRPKLIEEFGYKNPMQVPTIEKIVLNMGVGESTADSKKATVAAADLALDRRPEAGDHQGPQGDRAVQGARGHADRRARSRCARRACTSSSTGSCTVALPRVRDFRGLNPKTFDGRGNYALGIKEHIVFPEINYDKVEQVWGMDVIISTTAKTDDEARALLKHFNFPFRQ